MPDSESESIDDMMGDDLLIDDIAFYGSLHIDYQFALKKIGRILNLGGLTSYLKLSEEILSDFFSPNILVRHCTDDFPGLTIPQGSKDIDIPFDAADAAETCLIAGGALLDFLADVFDTDSREAALLRVASYYDPLGQNMLEDVIDEVDKYIAVGSFALAALATGGTSIPASVQWGLLLLGASIDVTQILNDDSLTDEEKERALLFVGFTSVVQTLGIRVSSAEIARQMAGLSPARGAQIVKAFNTLSAETALGEMTDDYNSAFETIKDAYKDIYGLSEEEARLATESTIDTMKIDEEQQKQFDDLFE